ncbi:MAG: polyprenyl synthetase family protein [Planctomycetes bacterium]|nr:polyprenyl synthetase family protein [Planctomycetota bacterium]
MDRLLAFITAVSAAADQRLDHFLPHADLRPENLHQAMRYSVLVGGKRLRPLLTLSAYDASDGDIANRDQALDAGCAIEFLHAYSLVHDDLPAMDNDAIRRNRLATHKAFGETTAILVGDALQALAFKVMAAAGGELAGWVVTELARAAGSTGMVGGQTLDLEGEGKPQVLEEIERIDRWKTGALFTCCCRVGAILAGANDDKLAALTHYGDAIGVLYQISDDLMDLTADPGKLGKMPGKDLQAGKLTYPAALGIEGAKEALFRKGGEAKCAVRHLGKEALYLRLLADYLMERMA